MTALHNNNNNNWSNNNNNKSCPALELNWVTDKATVVIPRVVVVVAVVSPGVREAKQVAVQGVCVRVCVCCGAYVSIQLPTHIGCQSNRINSKQHCAPHQSLTGLLSKRGKEDVEAEGATLVVFIRRWANKILYYFIMWKLLILIWYHNLLEPSNLAPASFLSTPLPPYCCGILINWISIH